jgi:hypothetical protein
MVLFSQLSDLPFSPSEFPFKYDVPCWNQGRNSKDKISIKFISDKSMPKWVFRKTVEAQKAAPSKYTEQDYFSGKRVVVKCIDEKVKTLFGKTGEVIQVVPFPQGVELDINFGRHIVRLTEKQIEILSEQELNPIS